MVKVAQMNIPPAYQSLLDKILAFFDNQIYPTWATRFFHKTRSAKKALKEKTYLPAVSDIWTGLTAPQKAAWASASLFGTLNNYQLFTSDYCFRRKNGLSLPGIPNDLHEMMGLRIANPGGGATVTLRRDEKDLVGLITIAFTYSKTQNAPTGGDPFNFLATAYYFDAGENKTDTKQWSAPSGNVAFSQVSEQFGMAGRKYYHLTVLVSLAAYDAICDIDHFLITDQNGDKYRENWQFKAGRVWEYDNLYRKTGWLLSPDYRVPYFEVVYLG